jgi:hypothetical protein
MHAMSRRAYVKAVPVNLLLNQLTQALASLCIIVMIAGML